jgi:hypothetical protein
MISPNLRCGNRRGTRGPRFRSGPGTVPGSDALAVCVQEQQGATTLSSLEEGARERERQRDREAEKSEADFSLCVCGNKLHTSVFERGFE